MQIKSIDDLYIDLKVAANPQKAQFLAGYFKTGKGEYGEGDIFLGITVPLLRKIAKKYSDLILVEIERLLENKIHEYRLVALMILSRQFEKAEIQEKEHLYTFYLEHARWINNWDLIDGSAPIIVGGYLLLHPEKRKNLIKLARSSSIWERRIAILATHQFIKVQKEYKDTFKIAEILLNDEHDLIHKGVGWMLREVGKRVSKKALEEFLSSHYKQMPRTMLRYSIEHFPEKERQVYIEGRI